MIVALAAALTACIPSIDRPQRDKAPRSVAQRDADHSPPRLPYLDPEYPSGNPASGVVTLPAPRPAWEARPVVADAQAVSAQSYVVRPGDTLARVSTATGAGVDAIVLVNRLSRPVTLATGQRLTIPGGRYHLVHPGESGIAIARAYGVPWAAVIEANGLVDPFLLRAGQRVLIPGLAAAAPPPSSAAERAARFRLNIDDILTGGEPALAAGAPPASPVATPARVLPSTAVVVAPPTRATGGFAWPVDGRIVSRFGPGEAGERQNGVNLAAPLGTPVKAAADGVVAYAGTGIQSLGGLVIVKHGGGWTSVYGYAARLLVQRGQAVTKGQTLAVSGQTGNADRPAVHFELRKGRTPVDPQSELPPL